VITDLDMTGLRPTDRRWRDVGRWRWAFGLAVAPLVPIALVSLLLTPLIGIFAPVVGGAIAVAASTWSLLFGFGYLYTVARIRRRIGRAECILLGVFIAATLPLVAVAAVLAFEPRKIFGPVSADGMPMVIAWSLLFAPFGGLGGWVFWRIGVRPAPPPVADPASVFD
jgi:hypothetical protein